MLELAYIGVLEASAERIKGSIPFVRTNGDVLHLKTYYSLMGAARTPALYMGHGTARSGHLTCNEESSRIRLPDGPP